MRTLKTLVVAVVLGLLISPALTYACDAPACKGKCEQTEQCKQKQANGGCKQDPSKCPMNGKK